MISVPLRAYKYIDHEQTNTHLTPTRANSADTWGAAQTNTP